MPWCVCFLPSQLLSTLSCFGAVSLNSFKLNKTLSKVIGAPLPTEANEGLEDIPWSIHWVTAERVLSGGATAFLKLTIDVLPEFIWHLHLSAIDNLGVTTLWFILAQGD